MPRAPRIYKRQLQYIKPCTSAAGSLALGLIIQIAKRMTSLGHFTRRVTHSHIRQEKEVRRPSLCHAACMSLMPPVCHVCVVCSEENLSSEQQ